MSEENRQKALDYLRALVARDRPRVEALITDDLKMWIPQSAATVKPMDIPLIGRAATMALLFDSKNFDHSNAKLTFYHTFAEGDMVCVHHNLQSHTYAGAPYNNDYVFMFRFKDGLIVETWEFTDTAYVFAKWKEPAPKK